MADFSLNNDPNDMGGEAWKNEMPSLAHAVQELGRRLLVERMREVETRISKLVAVGIPLYRLSILQNAACVCHGSGIVIEMTDAGLTGHTCTRCLGISMIIDQRTSIP